MSENLYMARRRAILEVVGEGAFIWMGFFGMLSWLAGQNLVWKTAESLLKSPLAVAFILLCFGTLILGKIRKVLFAPEIITTDTLLILDFGEYVLKWEDIERIDIFENNILIYRRRRFLKRYREPIHDIVDKDRLTHDLKMQGREKNITVATKSSWLFDHL